MLKRVQHSNITMGRLADVGQPTRRIEATRRVLGLGVVLSCDVGTATPDTSSDKSDSRKAEGSR